MPYFFSLMRASVHAGSCFVAASICFMAAPAQAGETTNKIGITMIDIPAGTFLMGSSKSTSVGYSEIPQHRVTLHAFRMGKTEVTLGQFRQFIDATGNTALINDDFIKYNAYGDDAPVVQVSWYDAQNFIAWLNKIDGGGYRLPSEAEWEYACRAGGNYTYCGSNKIGSIAWYGGNSDNHQHLVGSKQANDWGLYDMSGNVWEWVQDCSHDSYSGAPADGSVWSRGMCNWRGLRGGSWLNNAWGTRAAYRYVLKPGNRNSFNGFRLARNR